MSRFTSSFFRPNALRPRLRNSSLSNRTVTTVLIDKTWFKCPDIGHLFTYLSGYWILLLLRCWDIGYWALAASGYWLLPHSKQSNIQRLGLKDTVDVIRHGPIAHLPLANQEHRKLLRFSRHHGQALAKAPQWWWVRKSSPT